MRVGSRAHPTRDLLRVPRGRVEFPSVDHYQEFDDELTVRGATEKNVLKDPETGDCYIAKLGGRNNDLLVTTEFAINLIGRSIGVNVADAKVARYRGKLRFLSRYFLQREYAEQLVHGVELFNQLFDEKTVQQVLKAPVKEQQMFTVQSIKDAFGAHYQQFGPELEERLFGSFVTMLTHDALIGVNDRHSENWGLIVQREIVGRPPRFAPLYDSAGGIFGTYDEGQLGVFLGADSEGQLLKYINRARPLIGFEGLAPPPGRHLISHTQLLAEVYAQYPTHRPVIEQTLGGYDWRVVRHELCTELGSDLSARRRTLILVGLRRRHRAIWQAINDRMQPGRYNPAVKSGKP